MAGRDNEDEIDPELDPESPLFNPLKVLYGTDLPNIKIEIEDDEASGSNRKSSSKSDKMKKETNDKDEEKFFDKQVGREIKKEISERNLSLKDSKSKFTTNMDVKKEIDHHHVSRGIKKEIFDKQVGREIKKEISERNLSSKDPESRFTINVDVRKEIHHHKEIRIDSTPRIKVEKVISETNISSSSKNSRGKIKDGYFQNKGFSKQSSNSLRIESSDDPKHQDSLTDKVEDCAVTRPKASLRLHQSPVQTSTRLSSNPISSDSYRVQISENINSGIRSIRNETTTSEKKDNQPQVPNITDLSRGDEGANLRNKKEKKNLFTTMETVVGPFSLLKRCVKEKLQVRVMTRNATMARAICKGYIVAYDKYLNMAMIDVDEIYRRPKVLGKVKVKRSHKLREARGTLTKEREELKALRERNRDENDIVKKETTLGTNDNNNVSAQFSNLQNVSISSLRQILNVASTSKVNDDKTTPTLSSATDENSIKDANVRKGKQHGKSLENKLRHMKSIYPDLPAALSPFEREALMIGCPDENVEIRHINQVFIRGENIVSVNIVDDPETV